MSASAKLYRWVDDKGIVHYTDSIPPEYAQREKKVLEKGLVVDKIERKKTREEREAEEAAAEKIRQQKLAEETARKERERLDRVLIDTFPNVAAIEKSRDERLAIIDSSIKNNRIQTDDLLDKLNDERKKAARQERAGAGIDEDILKRIERLQAQIASNEQLEADKQIERQKLIEKFDADIKRFIQLTQKQ